MDGCRDGNKTSRPVQFHSLDLLASESIIFGIPATYNSPLLSLPRVDRHATGALDTHIVSKEEALLYEHNEMMNYDRDLGFINDPVYLVTLHVDIHKYFDKCWLIVVSKIPGADGAAQYVSHILSVSAGEIWSEYHNVLVQSPE
ncbi:hypothetical protein ACJ72_04654 [Emergomyces africanus]|uniref:HNH nuclease domain-containing protein n=1 Tax=Emergomyces africanus TaxID=1955775 RepID=A0A1B7NW60_9EURO|nr:hypothetical protein ACJ72_04654 [Emergomyces africanus]